MNAGIKIISGLMAAVIVFMCQAAVEAEEFIVKDGKANAEIVISEKPTRTQKYAAEELRDIIKKISGAELAITSKGTEATPVKIYVGKSEFTDTLKLSSAALKFGAFKIISGKNYVVFFGDDSDYTPSEPYARSSNDRKRAAKEWDEKTGGRWKLPGLSTFKSYSNKLKIWQGDGKGSLNAVYDFLRSLGVRWYFPGELGECLPELKSIALPEKNKTVHPDYGIRTIGGSGYVYGRGSNIIVQWNMRMGWRNNKSSVGTHGINFAL